jgi:hypothetical protein
MKRRPSSTRATSFKAGGIDLHQAVCGLDRSSYPVAQREVLGQHFFSTLKRELGPVDALPGIGNFRCQNVGHRPVALGFQSVHGFLTHGGRYRSLVSDKCTSACFAGRCRLRCDRQRRPAEEPDISHPLMMKDSAPSQPASSIATSSTLASRPLRPSMTPRR